MASPTSGADEHVINGNSEIAASNSVVEEAGSPLKPEKPSDDSRNSGSSGTTDPSGGDDGESGNSGSSGASGDPENEIVTFVVMMKRKKMTIL